MASMRCGSTNSNEQHRSEPVDFPHATFIQGTGSRRPAHSAPPYVPLTTTASFETFLDNPAKPLSKHFRFHQKIFDAPFSSLLSFPARSTDGILNGANRPKSRQITSILITALRGRYPARKAPITSARERLSIHRHPASLQAGPFRYDASQGSRQHRVLLDGMAGFIRRA